MLAYFKAAAVSLGLPLRLLKPTVTTFASIAHMHTNESKKNGV